MAHVGSQPYAGHPHPSLIAICVSLCLFLVVDVSSTHIYTTPIYQNNLYTVCGIIRQLGRRLEPSNKGDTENEQPEVQYLHFVKVVKESYICEMGGGAGGGNKVNDERKRTGYRAEVG